MKFQKNFKDSKEILKLSSSLRKAELMSVCVSSSLSSGGGMTHPTSHMHMTSALSMMHPFQNHQMTPSATNVNLSANNSVHSTQSQLQNNSSSDPQNEPNPEMLLALIARNKTLEGKRYFFLLFYNAVGKN
jgi:hypothetical protein